MVLQEYENLMLIASSIFGKKEPEGNPAASIEEAQAQLKAVFG